MSALYYYRQFDGDGLAANEKFERSEEAEEDLIIDRIYIKNKDGSELNKSTFYLKVVERVYTHRYVLASVVGSDKLVADQLSIPWNKGEKFHFTFQNLEGAPIDVGVVFRIIKP